MGYQSRQRNRLVQRPYNEKSPWSICGFVISFTYLEVCPTLRLVVKLHEEGPYLPYSLLYAKCLAQPWHIKCLLSGIA